MGGGGGGGGIQSIVGFILQEKGLHLSQVI